MKNILQLIENHCLNQKDWLQTLIDWSAINTFSTNFDGLASFSQILLKEFDVLNPESRCIVESEDRVLVTNQGLIEKQVLGSILSFKKHIDAPFQILLIGHMDTVFPPNATFQKARIEKDILIGPGVCDMKGGLLVMLQTLKILEKSPYAGNIGWQVIINSDEEISSVGSTSYIKEQAKNKNLCLVFEPAFPDGSIVNERKGSANFVIIVRGVKAHAGRDFSSGKNAITSLAKSIVAINELNHNPYETTINVGVIEGGIGLNVVPDLAIARINIRFTLKEEYSRNKDQIQHILETQKIETNCTYEFIELNHCFPKNYNEVQKPIFELYQEFAKTLNLNIGFTKSGGVCDGNTTANLNIPTIDTLGVVGGKMHTHEEYMIINSLVERIKISAFLLLQLASNRHYQERFL